MIESVVMDLDGTLLNDKMEVSEGNKEALRRLDALNIPYFIATGRPEQLVKPVVSALDYKRPLIMYNGSVIGHPFEERRLYSEPIPNRDIKDIVGHCEKRDMIVMLYTKDAIYSDPNYRVDFFKERNTALNDRDKAVFKTMDAFDYAYEVNKILIIEPDSQKRDTFIRHFSEDSELQKNLRLVRSQPSFLDINPKTTSKGKAIDRLHAHYGLDPKRCLAIGDQENDISMKDHAGVFVSMENATDEVKKMADFVTGSNSDDGVYTALKHYIPNL